MVFNTKITKRTVPSQRLHSRHGGLVILVALVFENLTYAELDRVGDHKPVLFVGR